MSIMDRILGHKELKNVGLWKALLAELIGTCFLVMVGCGSVGGTSTVGIALAFGLIVAVMVHCMAHISGGHINPAVTVGMVFSGNISILRAILYIIFQLVGAIIGAALLYALAPSSRVNLGQTNLSQGISLAQGFGIELFITFVLVFTVFAVVDPSRPEQKGIGPLIIGLSVSACHLWAIKHTGSSMNTARSFGPAVIGNNWKNHWVYWVGPLLGGAIAGFMYKLIFSTTQTEEVEEEQIAK